MRNRLHLLDDHRKALAAGCNPIGGCDLPAEAVASPDAEHAEINAKALLELGRHCQYQGRFSEARGRFNSAWEMAKAEGDVELRWRACLAISQVEMQSGNRNLALRYLQLSITAAMDGMQAGLILSLPEECRFEQSLLSLAVGQLSDSLPDLLRIRQQFTDPIQQGRLELEQAAALSGPASRDCLTNAWRYFHQGGDAYRAMLTLEQLAEQLLASQQWESGKICLQRALLLARQLRLTSKDEQYRHLLARLNRALAVLTASGNSGEWN